MLEWVLCKLEKWESKGVSAPSESDAKEKDFTDAAT